MPNWTNKKHTYTLVLGHRMAYTQYHSSADAFTFTMGYLCFSCPLESLFPLISETRTTATTECCTANWNETKRPKRVRVVWRLCWPGAYFMCAFKIINIGIIIISRSWSWLAGAAGKTRARINGLPSILSRTHIHIGTYTYTHGYMWFYCLKLFMQIHQKNTARRTVLTGWSRGKRKGWCRSRWRRLDLYQVIQTIVAVGGWEAYRMLRAECYRCCWVWKNGLSKACSEFLPSARARALCPVSRGSIVFFFSSTTYLLQAHGSKTASIHTDRRVCLFALVSLC